MKINENFYFILNNTPINYPVCLSVSEALNYLTFINSNDFQYNNISNYDIIDYEKLIYIETNFNDNIEIQELLKEIKSNIAFAYKLKNQYKNRIFDFPTGQEERIFEYTTQKYYGLPRNLLKKEEDK